MATSERLSRGPRLRRNSVSRDSLVATVSCCGIWPPPRCCNLYATASETDLGAVRSARVELGDQPLDPPADLVADRPDRLDAEARGVVEDPVLVAPARVERALVAAAHRDDDVGRPDRGVAEQRGPLGGDVDPLLGHRLHGRGVELVGGLGARGEDLDPVAREVLEVA